METASEKKSATLIQLVKKSVFADWVNPVFVKEMRQEFSSKTGLIAWGIILIILALSYYSNLDNFSTSGFSQISYQLLILNFLPVIRLLCQWNGEREHDYLILENTPLTISQILHGKFLAGITTYGIGFLLFLLFYAYTLFKVSRMATVPFADFLLYAGLASLLIFLIAVNYFLFCSLQALSLRHYPRFMEIAVFIIVMLISVAIQTNLADSSFTYCYNVEAPHGRYYEPTTNYLKDFLIIFYFAMAGGIYFYMVCRSLLKAVSSERFLILKPVGLILAYLSIPVELLHSWLIKHDTAGDYSAYMHYEEKAIIYWLPFMALIVIHLLLLCQESWRPSHRIMEERQRKAAGIRFLQKYFGSGIIQEYVYVLILTGLLTICHQAYSGKWDGFIILPLLLIFYVSTGLCISSLIRKPFFTILNSAMLAAGVINFLGLVLIILGLGDLPFSLFTLGTLGTRSIKTIVIYLLGSVLLFLVSFFKNLYKSGRDKLQP